MASAASLSDCDSAVQSGVKSAAVPFTVTRWCSRSPARFAPSWRSRNSSAAALLSYDVAHSIPWDWRVSLYTWTKGIAAGVYLVAALLVVMGLLSRTSPLWLWFAPIVSGAFLGFTGALLLWDLEHPKRFYLIFTRPQWRSWLVKGAFIIAAYSAVLAAHFAASLAGLDSLQLWLTIAGIPLSVGTAVYTAYLFAQAKARDLWQNPLLPPHLFFQAILLGAAVLAPLSSTRVGTRTSGL